MNPITALATVFFAHLENTPPLRMPRSFLGFRYRVGARRAGGPLAPKCDAVADCRRYAGKTMRHRFTGQVREAVVTDDGVEFAQDHGRMPRFMRRSFMAARKWLRNAEVVA